MAALRQLRNQNRKLYPQIIPVYPIWTKISMSMLVTPKNESIEELLIFLKFQDGGLWSKIQNWPNLTSQITFQLGISIPFIRFGQNFAWTYKLTLETKLRKKFTFFKKFKMAASGQKLNFDKISAQKSHFGLANRSRSSDLDQICQEHTTWP